MRNIYVHDLGSIKCRHYGYYIVMVLLLALAMFSTGVALHNSKPICNDLKPVQNSIGERSLECIFNLGNIQEDQADVIIAK